jgi:thermostable 8-oxoguanine DNA glycosylase
MSDLSAIRVLNFSGRKEEWPIWSEKFLAKAKCSRIKDVLLGKLQISKTTEELEEKSEEGRRMMKNAELNKLAFTELKLSIDVSNSSGKIAYGILKSCKTKDYEDGNATHAWKKLKKKFDPVSAPTLVKTERMFRGSKFGRNEDPEIWKKSWA